jgi:hypothetical protein
VTLLRREKYLRSLKLCKKKSIYNWPVKDIIATGGDNSNAILSRILHNLLYINCCTQSYPYVSIVTGSVLATAKLQAFEITDNSTAKCITGQYYQLFPKLVHFTNNKGT